MSQFSLPLSYSDDVNVVMSSSHKVSFYEWRIAKKRSSASQLSQLWKKQRVLLWFFAFWNFFQQLSRSCTFFFASSKWSMHGLLLRKVFHKTCISSVLTHWDAILSTAITFPSFFIAENIHPGCSNIFWNILSNGIIDDKIGTFFEKLKIIAE